MKEVVIMIITLLGMLDYNKLRKRAKFCQSREDRIEQ